METTFYSPRFPSLPIQRLKLALYAYSVVPKTCHWNASNVGRSKNSSYNKWWLSFPCPPSPTTQFYFSADFPMIFPTTSQPATNPIHHTADAPSSLCQPTLLIFNHFSTFHPLFNWFRSLESIFSPRHDATRNIAKKKNADIILFIFKQNLLSYL